MLISEKLGGASEAKSEVVRHLNDSIVYLHHILQQPYHLREEIYDKINALTLINFLQNSLNDPEQRFEYRSEKYDFRTIEFARMLFLISAKYLMKSPPFVDEEIVKQDIDRVSYHFRILAKSFLEKEFDVKIEKDVHQMKNELYKSGLKKEYQMLDEEYSKLVKKKKETTFIDFIKKISDELDEITKKRSRVQDEFNKKEYEIKQKDSQKYDHLKFFYCPVNRLEPFIGIQNPYLPDDPSETKYLM